MFQDTYMWKIQIVQNKHHNVFLKEKKYDQHVLVEQFYMCTY
jgi:hypothetical protein